jgi:hypothetical protein
VNSTVIALWLRQNFVLVGWRAQESELHHHVWFSEHSQATALRA